jgi:hypothetical protein
VHFAFQKILSKPQSSTWIGLLIPEARQRLSKGYVKNLASENLGRGFHVKL